MMEYIKVIKTENGNHKAILTQNFNNCKLCEIDQNALEHYKLKGIKDYVIIIGPIWSSADMYSMSLAINIIEPLKGLSLYLKPYEKIRELKDFMKPCFAESKKDISTPIWFFIKNSNQAAIYHNKIFTPQTLKNEILKIYNIKNSN